MGSLHSQSSIDFQSIHCYHNWNGGIICNFLFVLIVNFDLSIIGQSIEFINYLYCFTTNHNILIAYKSFINICVYNECVIAICFFVVVSPSFVCGHRFFFLALIVHV